MRMWIRIDHFPINLDDTEQATALALCHALHIPSAALLSWRIMRKALDARKRQHIHWICSIVCDLAPNCQPILSAHAHKMAASALNTSKPQSLQCDGSAHASTAHVIIIGAGPAGLFAALALAESHMRVTLLERGKPVETRMRDIGLLRSRGILNPESNICFGEGGAGTYTDGKLYTRIKHPFVHHVLREMVRFGAKDDILVDAHPHIGSDKLVRLVRNMRQHLLQLGVDYRFESRVDGIVQSDGMARGVQLADGTEIMGDHIILAVGHSARDTFERLLPQGIHMEAKDFAVGVRTEHPQAWVNQCQFGANARHPALSAAEYRLSHQVHDATIGKRGVYSFCMCPGGLIVPSPTEHGLLAINGMSNAKRSAMHANSGVVVQVTQQDLQAYGSDALVGIRMQRELEQRAFAMTSAAYAAPAMRISDFVRQRATGILARTCYKPGIEAHDLNTLFPAWIHQPLREGLIAFDRKMKGYVSDEANMLGVESRTSSPIRITRGADMQSISLARLYPAGEGAGYAGGIVSAAVDGLKAAEAILQQYK